jgi:hypothetical protein
MFNKLMMSSHVCGGRKMRSPLSGKGDLLVLEALVVEVGADLLAETSRDLVELEERCERWLRGNFGEHLRSSSSKVVGAMKARLILVARRSACWLLLFHAF